MYNERDSLTSGYKINLYIVMINQPTTISYVFLHLAYGYIYASLSEYQYHDNNNDLLMPTIQQKFLTHTLFILVLRPD